MHRRVRDAGLQDDIEIDSAGTGGWHVGDEADERARAEAVRRGIEMVSRARQVHAGDLEYFDLVIAMDARNRADVLKLVLTDEHRSKVRLLREFDAESSLGDLDVPDPYFGGPDGFRDVFDLIDRACAGLLEHVRATHLDPA